MGSALRSLLASDLWPTCKYLGWPLLGAFGCLDDRIDVVSAVTVFTVVGEREAAHSHSVTLGA